MDETGGRERFAEWVRVHGEAVRGFIFARVRRPDAVEDMVQEVFCRAWSARDRYQEQGASLAYLLTIADRLVCDRGRRGQPERNLDYEQWKEFEPPSRADDPLQAAAIREQSEQLAAAMDRLSAVQQRVLLLRYYGQLTFAEIAEIIECPLNTTLSHCRRGLETLRKIMADDPA